MKLENRHMRRVVASLAVAVVTFGCGSNDGDPPLDDRARVMRAVVQVAAVHDRTGQVFSLGSGTIISPEGHILTNYHVIGDTDTGVFHRLAEIYQTTHPAEAPAHAFMAEYVDGDAALDLALLRIVGDALGDPLDPSVELPVVQVGDSDLLRPPDPLVAVGYPGISGSTVTFTPGAMSGWLGEDLVAGGKRWIKTSADINRGNSGGAALNTNWELVGIPTQGTVRVFGNSADVERQDVLRPVALAWSIIPGSVEVAVAEGVARPDSVGDRGDVPAVSAGDVLESGTYGAIELNASVHGRIAPAPSTDRPVFNTYVATVGSDVGVLTVRLEGEDDVDLAVKANSEILNLGASSTDADFFDNAAAHNATYELIGPSPGDYYIDVFSIFARPIDYTLTVETSARVAVEPSDDPLVWGWGATEIAIGESVSDLLSGPTVTGLSTFVDSDTYVVDVPLFTDSLRIELSGPAHFDLAVKEGFLILDRGFAGDATVRDVSDDTPTVLTIRDPFPGLWFIDVFSERGPPDVMVYTLTVR